MYLAKDINLSETMQGQTITDLRIWEIKRILNTAFLSNTYYMYKNSRIVLCQVPFYRFVSLKALLVKNTEFKE